MHILHIANSYGGTSVYTNMVKALDEHGIKQTVFVPLNPRNHNRIGKKLIDFKTEGSSIVYDVSLKNYHRYFYGRKIARMVKAVEKKIDLSSITLIHSGTLCSDGAVAYELHKKYGIPFVSAVRNTDLNSYYDKLFWRKKYFDNIVKEASQVIFINPAHKQYFEHKYSPLEVETDKYIIIPNGVDVFF